MVSAVGNPDLSRDDPRGLVIFPAEPARTPSAGDWWLVPAAILLAAAMIAVAFAIR
jgi:hypothetical protein